MDKTNTLALALGISPRIFAAITATEHLGAVRRGVYPIAPGKDIRRV